MAVSQGTNFKNIKNNFTQLSVQYPKLTPFIMGCIFSLSFEPFGWFPILFFIIPFLLLSIIKQTEWRKNFNFGWWFGFGHYLTSLYWIGNSFLQQSSVPIWTAPLAVLALAYVLAYFFALTFSLVTYFKGPSWTKVIAFTSVWSLLEWIKGHIFTGFPWNPIGGIWTSFEPVMQFASVVGVYGLTYISILFSSSLVLFLINNKLVFNDKIFLSLNALFLIIILSFGTNRLMGAKVEYHPNINFRIVQANISQKEKWVREKWSENFYKHIEMSKSALSSQTPPDFVIWPETAIPYFIGSEPGRQVLLAEMLENKTAVISGAPRIDRSEGDIKLFNSVHVIGKDGRLKGTYDKVHLVPFGEYLPLRGLLSLIGLEKLTAGSLDFSSGEENKTLFVPGIPSFGVLVCYEIIFPNQVVGKERPNWLLNVTNDGWFGESSGPYQHFAMSRFRAVEEGLPVIRSAGTGISGVIDPWGRVIHKLELNKMGILDSNLPKKIEFPTIYSKFGDKIFFLIVLLGLLIPRFWPFRLYFNTKG